MNGPAPWHQGELAAQQQAGGDPTYAEQAGRALRPTVSDPQQAFFASLPFALVGWLDDDGGPWAAAITGQPGFIACPTADRLTIAGDGAAGDPLLAARLTAGGPLGLLGIDLSTRRRNRINGVAEAAGDAGRTMLRVVQSFGNCPKYIRRRDGLTAAPLTDRPIIETAGLSNEAAALIRRADTCFVATAAPETHNGGVDLSHRGGPAGFVRVDPDGALRLPDYSGNGYFNTLGNLMVYPRAGLLFIDFATGDTVQASGPAVIDWEAGGATQTAEPAAERWWRLTPQRVRLRRGGFPFRATPA